MATIAQITSDPRFASLPPEKKQKIVSMAEDYNGSNLPSDSEPSKLREAIGAVPGLIQKIGHLVPGMEPLSAVSEMYPASQEIKEGFPKAGGAIAENLGKRGWNPNVAAIPATAVSIAPEIASSAMGLGEVVAGKSALSQAIRKTPKMLGPEFQAGERAAGISGDLPVQRGAIPKFPNLAGEASNAPPSVAPLVAPKTYPKDLPSLINFAKARVQAFGERLSPQELDDYKTMLSTNLSEMKAKGLSKTEPFAIASNLQKQVTELHNAVVPGREELNRIYSISKKLHPDMGDWISKGVEKYGVKAIGAVLAGLGIGAGAKMASR